MAKRFFNDLTLRRVRPNSDFMILFFLLYSTSRLDSSFEKMTKKFLNYLISRPNSDFMLTALSFDYLDSH